MSSRIPWICGTVAAIAHNAFPTIIQHARSFFSCSGLVIDVAPSVFYFHLAPENADANPSAINPPPETLRWMRRTRRLPGMRSATVPAINA